MRIHSVKYNFIMNFLLSVSSFIFPLITFPYVSRVLTADGVGAVSFAISFVSYFTLVASLGIPVYGIRACAEVRNDKDKLYTVAQELLIINIVTTLLTVAVYICSIQIIPRLAEDKILFYICGLNIVLNALGSNWFFQAIEQFSYITIRSLALKLISLILLFVLVHGASDYLIYAGITVIAAVGSCILNFFRMLRLGVLKKRRKYSFRRHLKPALILFAQSATVSVYTNLDTVMLGMMRGNNDVGYYYVATQIKQIFLMLITSFSNVLLPRMTSFATEGKNEKFYSTMATGLNFSLFISLPIAFMFAIIGEDLIFVIAGSGYLESVLPAKILLFALIVIGLTQVIGIQVLTPLKQENKVFLSVAFGAITNVFLNLILIPRLGVVGVAVATLVAETVVLLLQSIFARKQLMQVKSKIRVIKYLGSTLISFIVCLMIYVFFPAECQLIKAIIACLAFLISYILVLRVFGDSFVLEGLNDLRKIISLIKKNLIFD